MLAWRSSTDMLLAMDRTVIRKEQPSASIALFIEPATAPGYEHWIRAPVRPTQLGGRRAGGQCGPPDCGRLCLTQARASQRNANWRGYRDYAERPWELKRDLCQWPGHPLRAPHHGGRPGRDRQYPDSRTCHQLAAAILRASDPPTALVGAERPLPRQIPVRASLAGDPGLNFDPGPELCAISRAETDFKGEPRRLD